LLDLVDEAQATLGLAEYATSRFDGLPVPVVLFEDQTTVGFIYLFGSAAALLERWRDLEQAALTAQSVRLRAAGKKAWNIYSIFLTEAEATSDESHRIQRIEEDLVSTRKIARARIQTSADLREALAPLLPLQSGSSEQPERYDQRLREAIHTLTAAQKDTLFEPDDPERIASKLVRLLDPDNAA
jgi:hypothetical protein